MALIGLGLCAQARSTSVTTTDGATYYNVTAEHVYPDGLILEYTIPGGGIGMSKVKFGRLSADQQKQYGYDPAKARDYEAQVAKAQEEYRQECIKRDEAAKSQRANDMVQQDQRERMINDRIDALTRLEQAEARLAEVAPNYGGDNFGSGWGWGGDGFGLVALPNVGRAPRARTDFAPVVTPVPFPTVNVPSTTQQHVRQNVHVPAHSGMR